MLSLQDKLSAVRRSPQACVKRAAEDCHISETRYPGIIRAPGCLRANTLQVMQGLETDSDIPYEQIVFLDTETTGLSGGAGTIAFLVGIGTMEGSELVVRQYLMRDYDEEAFMLAEAAKRLKASQLLVTFNGAAFDMPLLESRFTMQRMHADLNIPPHADLLHTARRVFKRRLRKCSLAALEEEIFGQQRADDLPGCEIPERYFSYLKTKDFSLLDDILTHNAQDIVSLARLLFHLTRLHEEPAAAGYPEDILSLGRVYEKRGLHETARLCFRASDSGRLSALSRTFLADSLRKCQNYRQAAAVYEQMLLQGQGTASTYISLSKLYEHRLHDNARALDSARKGMQYCMNCASAAMNGDMLDDLQRRHMRLLLKQGGHKDGTDTKF
jgi:uncharacterized protein